MFDHGIKTKRETMVVVVVMVAVVVMVVVGGGEEWGGSGRIVGKRPISFSTKDGPARGERGERRGRGRGFGSQYHCIGKRRSL